MIPYGRQHVTQADVDAVLAVLRSEFLTQGPAVGRFESAVATKTGARYAVAMNSATSALHVACLALDLGPGDRLWTSANTFVASANCGVYCGAAIDFVDIDPRTWNMSVEALADKLASAERDGILPKVVVPVHFAGQSCDMRQIHELARRYGFRVIEDASHAIGGRYRGKPIGACEYSDITVFSFHPVKVITTGEGGVAITNDAALVERMSRLRTHGITRDPKSMHTEPPGEWYYEQLELGFNYRLTDIQAALGSSQLPRLDEYVARRNELAAGYERLLSDLPLQLPFIQDWAYSAFHLYVVLLTHEAPVPRATVFRRLRQAGIGVNVHYIPVYRQPYYRLLGFPPHYCEQAERYYECAVSLPMFPGLTDEDLDRVSSHLKESLS